MTLASMKNNLLRFVPGLNPELIESNLQDSYRQLASRDWNRLRLQRQIYTASIYSTGTVSVTTDGVVTGVGTTFTSEMVGSFMKVHYPDSFFEIVSFTSATEIKLKDWAGAVVASGTAYSIFKTIYTLDSTFKLLYEVAYQTTLKKKSQTYFNHLDPTRTGTSSTPLYWAYAGTTTAGVMQIEIYPVPSAIVPLRVYGKLAITTLGEADTPNLPEDLIEAHTLLNCYRVKAALKPKEGWEQKMAFQIDFYKELLANFEQEDFMLGDHYDKVKDMMDEVDFPQDDNFRLSHDVD